MKSQNEIADISVARIKDVIQKTNLNYFISESPFSVNIKLKKSLVSRYNKNETSSNGQINDSSENDPAQADQTKCNSCEDINQRLTEVQNELIATILEHGQRVKDLESVAQNTIERLEVRIANEKEENNKLKAELKNKNEQLKKKNKSVDDAILKLETTEKETESLKSNLTNKLHNLEKKNKTLIEDLELKKCELKKEKNSLKKLCSKQTRKIEEKKSSNKETQTEDIQNCKMETQSIQTNSSETVDASTSPLFTNIYLEGKPTHDLTCLCLCHEEDKKCELQLFKYSTDTDEAVETIYYKEDYDNYDDVSYDEIESPNEEVLQKLIRIKTLTDEELMKEMVGDALKKYIEDKAVKESNIDNKDLE